MGPLAILVSNLLFYALFPATMLVAFIAAFDAQIAWDCYVGLIILTGCVGVAFLSIRIFKSRQLAIITLASGLLSHGIQEGWTRYSSSRARARYSVRADSAKVALRQVVRGYAKLGSARFEVAEPLSKNLYNEHPEFGPRYGKLAITVPVSVHEPGTYQLKVRYRDDESSVPTIPDFIEVVDTLDTGEHEIQVVFDSRSSEYPRLWSPAATGGTATTELDFDVDSIRLFRFYRSRGKDLRPVSWSPLNLMRVDSAGTVFPGGVRVAATPQSSPGNRPSGLTDREEDERRRRTKR